MRFIIDALRAFLLDASSSRGALIGAYEMVVSRAGDVVASSARAEFGPSSAGNSSIAAIGLTTGEVSYRYDDRLDIGHCLFPDT